MFTGSVFITHCRFWRCSDIVAIPTLGLNGWELGPSQNTCCSRMDEVGLVLAFLVVWCVNKHSSLLRPQLFCQNMKHISCPCIIFVYFFVLSRQTSILCKMGELAVGGSEAVALAGVGDR